MTLKPHRKQIKRFETPGHVRFLTFSCYRRLTLFGNDRIKDAFVDSLREARSRFHFQLIGWIVMPTHVHLMILPDLPDHPVAKILKSLKTNFASTVLDHWRLVAAPILARIGDSRGTLHFWQQGGGYDRNIVSQTEFFEKLEYIHVNPVDAGLVAHPCDWQWSSARWYAGDIEGSLIEIDPFIP